MKLRFMLFFAIFFSLVGWGPFFYFPTGNAWINQTIAAIRIQASNIDPSALKVALNAYLKARKLGLNAKEILTLVDYSKPSDERRLWVIDIKHLKVLYNTYVAHGKNSG